jgi:hypothetical protein
MSPACCASRVSLALMDDKPGFEKVRVRACGNRNSRQPPERPAATRATAKAPRRRPGRIAVERHPRSLTDRAAKLLRSGRCTPAVRGGENDRGFDRTDRHKDRDERRKEVRRQVHSLSKLRCGRPPPALRRPIYERGKNLQARALTTFWPSNFSRRAPQGSTTVRGHRGRRRLRPKLPRKCPAPLMHVAPVGSAPAHALHEPAMRDVN